MGLLSLNLDQTVLQLVPRKYLKSLVAGPAFEPQTVSIEKLREVLTTQILKGRKKAAVDNCKNREK